MRCLVFHKWSGWTTTNTARLAEAIGAGAQRVQYRICERCGTSQTKEA